LISTSIGAFLCSDTNANPWKHSREETHDEEGGMRDDLLEQGLVVVVVVDLVQEDRGTEKERSVLTSSLLPYSCIHSLLGFIVD